MGFSIKHKVCTLSFEVKFVIDEIAKATSNSNIIGISTDRNSSTFLLLFNFTSNYVIFFQN